MRQRNRIIKINNSLNAQKLSNKSIPSSNNLLLPNPHFKEEILFSNKSQKDILLSLIKSAQVSLLASLKQKSSNSKPKKMNFFFKNLLLDLKKNLLFAVNEKNLSKSYYENNIKSTKLQIQKNYDIFSKKSEGNELSKLKILNFIIENDILETDFMIEKTQKLISYLKITKIFPEENREIFLKNKNEIDKILNVKVKKGKELLKELITKKLKQNENIKKLKEEIIEIKQDLGLKNSIESTDIILEETSENRVFSNFNSISNKDDNVVDKSNKDNIESKIFNNDINAQRQSFLETNNVNNVFNLNMNINFNINLHDIINKSFDDNLKENNDNKEKEINQTKYNKYKICNSSEYDFGKELKTIKKILSDRGAMPNNDILFH
jgi:hypothetical protein